MALSNVLPDGPESLGLLEIFCNNFTSNTLWALLKCEQLKKDLVVKCERQSVKKEEADPKAKRKSLVKDGGW